jgi:uncharacterized protein YceK
MNKLAICLLLIAVIVVSGCIGQVQQEVPKTGVQQSTSASACTSNWQCTGWSECAPTSTQTRTCTDLNNCGATDKPVTSRSCTYSKQFDKFELKSLIEKDYTCGGYCRYLSKVSAMTYANGVLYVEQGGTFIIPNNQGLYNELQGRAKVIVDYFDRTAADKPAKVLLKEIITHDIGADEGFKLTDKTPTNCYSSDNPTNCFQQIIYHTELSWADFEKMANLDMSYSAWLSATQLSGG